MATPAESLALAREYLDTGNIELAERFATSVLEEEPSHAGGLHLLGLVARQKGKLDEAIVFLNRSLTANGASAAVWQDAGDVLFAAGDTRGGITYYEQALRLRPDFAEGHNTLGMAWQRLGDGARAEQCLREATRLAPSFAPAFNNLGTALRAQGKWQEAAEAFQQALKLQPDSADVAYNLGNVYHDRGDLSQAVAYYREALRFRPSYAAEVSNSLACALRTQGLWSEAVAQFQETLKLRPDHAMALYNLSELAVSGHYAFPPAEVERVKAVSALGRGSDEEQILHSFALGNLLNVQGAFDDAFARFRQANDLRQRLSKKRHAAFDALAHQALVDKIMSEHGRAYFERVKKWSTHTELPVFVVGMPCSGAALVEQALAGHSRVSVASDGCNVYRLFMQAPAAKDATVSFAQLVPNVRAARQAAADLLQHFAHLAKGATRVALGGLENALALGFLGTLFRGAHVVYCRRDPLDTCLASYLQRFPDLPFASALADIGAYHAAFDRLMAHWSRVLPLQIHEITYDDLAQNQEAALRALLSFCGLEWEECLSAQTLATISSRRPPLGETVGLWRRYRSHLGPLFRALGRSEENEA